MTHDEEVMLARASKEEQLLLRKNDWEGIMKAYNIADLKNDIPLDYPVDNVAGILWAASHWAQSFTKEVINGNFRRRNEKNPNGAAKVSKCFEIWLWLFNQSRRLLESGKADDLIKKTVAYNYYNLYINGNRELVTAQRSYGVNDSRYSDFTRDMTANAFENARKLYEEILEASPEDIKSNYRMANLIVQHLKQLDVKKTADKTDYKAGYDYALELLRRAIAKYESLKDKASKDRYRKEYVKACFTVAKVTNDEIYMAYDEKPFQNKKAFVTIYARNVHGIKTTNLQDVKVMEEMMAKVCREMGIPEELADDGDIKRVAAIKEPIVSLTAIYYRYGKIYWLMNRIYCSDWYKIAEARKRNPELVKQKIADYEDKALQYLRCTLELRHTRKNMGIPDSDGVVYELPLLAKIYHLGSNKIYMSELAELVRKYGHRNQAVNYYFALAKLQPYYKSDAGCTDSKVKDEVMNILSNITTSRDRIYVNKAKRLMEDLEKWPAAS